MSWNGSKDSHVSVAVAQMSLVDGIEAPRSQSSGSATVQATPTWKGYFLCISVSKCGCTDESETEILPRGGAMEAVQTPKPATVARGDQIFGQPDDGVRMDGKRDNHGLYHCIS